MLATFIVGSDGPFWHGFDPIAQVESVKALHMVCCCQVHNGPSKMEMRHSYQEGFLMCSEMTSIGHCNFAEVSEWWLQRQVPIHLHSAATLDDCHSER